MIGAKEIKTKSVPQKVEESMIIIDHKSIIDSFI